MTILSSINHLNGVNYFKELPFYNKPIERTKIKILKSIDLLDELPFYQQLSIIKSNQAFSGYAMSHQVEIIERKDLIVQLEASKLSIKALLNDLLNETKGFKYQITAKVLLEKYKHDGETEFAPIYFNSWTKTIINNRFKLANAFQEILQRIDAWINEGSGQIVESIEPQYINISIYRSLLGSSYIELPTELRSPKKGLINIKNEDQKCFLWCHVRYINPSKEHPGRIKKIDKKIAKKLNFDEIEFPVKEKDFNKIEVKNYISINVSGNENNLIFPIYISDKKFEGSMDILLLIEHDKSHYVYIKNFNRFLFHKTKNKNKKWYCRSCLQCFSSENLLIKHKNDCLSINGAQFVRVEEGMIEFRNYFKQLPTPFKIYADFECNLRDVEIYEGSYTRKYHDHVPCSYAYKIVCIDDKFSKPIIIYRSENAAYEFIKAILKEYKYCKKIIKKHFNKNLIMSKEEEYSFQQSNNCWICKKLIDNNNKKARDHCHVTGKFRGAGHWNFNINFQLTKEIPVIFHNLKGYDGHLILSELNKFDVKIGVIRNGLEKYMTFFLSKNLVF